MAKKALCIGINDYPGTESDLAGCVNDANDWAAVFEKQGFRVEKMFNKQATGKAMHKAIKALVGSAKGRDSVIIQYSGHGSFVPDVDGDEPDGTDECLCPREGRTAHSHSLPFAPSNPCHGALPTLTGSRRSGACSLPGSILNPRISMAQPA